MMKGVRFDLKKNLYIATISYQGDKYYLGSSIFEEESKILRKLAEKAKDENKFESFYQTLRCKNIKMKGI